MVEEVNCNPLVRVLQRQTLGRCRGSACRTGLLETCWRHIQGAALRVGDPDRHA